MTMAVFQNFILALANILHLVFMLYVYIIIARAIMSWFQPNPYNQFVQFIFRITEPVLSWVRQFIPSFGGLDLSPVVVIFVILFLDNFIVGTLRQMAF